MLNLIIKGSFEQARAALDARKLQTCTMLTAVSTEAGFDGEEIYNIVKEVGAQVHDSDFAIVAAWFAEPPVKAPFPPGTLIHFSSTLKIEQE